MTKEQIKEDVRVKYLDKEDIESLGWKLKSINSNPHIHEWLFEMKSRIDGSGEWSWLLQLLYPPTLDYIHENIAIYYVQTTKNVINESTKFEGTIKNKSELKVLMKQLNITKI